PRRSKIANRRAKKELATGGLLILMDDAAIDAKLAAMELTDDLWGGGSSRGPAAAPAGRLRVRHQTGLAQRLDNPSQLGDIKPPDVTRNYLRSCCVPGGWQGFGRVLCVRGTA